MRLVTTLSTLGIAGLSVLVGSAAVASGDTAERQAALSTSVARNATDLPIQEYVALLRGSPVRPFTLRYVNEPMEGTTATRLHHDDTMVVDEDGATQSRYVLSGRYWWETRTFSNYTYTSVTDNVDSPPAWSVVQSTESPMQSVEALILYFTGSDNYPQDSVGQVNGDTVTFTGRLDDSFDGGETRFVETSCSLRPESAQPLCRIRLAGKLIATITFVTGGDDIERPQLPRVLPAGYNPVTDRFVTLDSLTAAAKRANPLPARVRASLGKSVVTSQAGSFETAAALNSLTYFTTRTEMIAKLTYVSTRDADLFMQSVRGQRTVVKFDAGSKTVTMTEPGQYVVVFREHKGMLAVVQAASRSTAQKVLSLLR